ncbi:MAG: hypothetical protein WCO84_09565, partial [bacterium]
PMDLSYTSLKSNLDRALALRDSATTRLKGTRRDIERLEKELILIDGVQALFQKFIDQEVNIGVQAVTQLLTEGLQAVFNDQDIQVKANVVLERGKVAVELVTHQTPAGADHEIEGDPNDSFGGSVATVQSVLLRVIIVFKRGLRPVFFFDETLGAFDPNYVINMGTFLNTLSKRLGMDILDVTQNTPLLETANRAYRIKRNGHAVFSEAK